MRIDQNYSVPGPGWVATVFFNGKEALDHYGRIEVADEDAGYMDVVINHVIRNPPFTTPHLLAHRLWGKVEIKMHNWMAQGLRGDIHPF